MRLDQSGRLTKQTPQFLKENSKKIFGPMKNTVAYDGMIRTNENNQRVIERHRLQSEVRLQWAGACLETPKFISLYTALEINPIKKNPLEDQE